MSKIQLAINIALSVTLLILIYFQFFKTQKVVYVDSAQLLNNYEGMINARKAFQAKAEGWKANIDTLTNEVKSSIMDYEKEQGRMSTKERELSQELIRSKQQQLSQYQQAMNTQAQQEDQKMTSAVVVQVNAYLKKYGEQKGYTIIFAATDYGNIAYADEKLNVTEEVLEGLNKEYKGQ